MKKTFFILFLLIVFLGIFSFIKNSLRPTSNPQNVQDITLALDWTPNTNHTGFYVALAKGWYKNLGIQLKILPYSSTVSPDVLVASNKADIGISSTEGVIADAALKENVVSIAAIIQHNTSSLAVLEESDIKSPRDLGGKVYGGFGAPSEEAVVNAIIKKDGGLTTGIKYIILDTGAMEALRSKKIDVVWIYEGWEGVQARIEGMKLRTFPITAYGIPDYYTPVIIANKITGEKKATLIKKFMQATAKGYEYSRLNPRETAQILIDQAPKGTFPDRRLVFASQEYLSARYADKGLKWGVQEKNAWVGYPTFLQKAGTVVDGEGKVVKNIDFEKLYTNEFIQ